MKGRIRFFLHKWIHNKEAHAEKIQEIVAQYFMTQLVKSGTPYYSKKITLLHHMLAAAMKCKQTTDLTHPASLRETVREFQTIYFKKP